MQSLYKTSLNPIQNLKDHHSRPHPLKIVALGDSLVYGFGDPVGGGWIERMRRQWMCPSNPGPVIYNLGVRGNRLIEVSSRLETEFRHRGELRNTLPDLIILSVGVNDSARIGHLKGRCFTELELFKNQLYQLLNQAQKLCPVLFIGMVPVAEEKMPFQGCFYFNHEDQYRYSEVTKRGCQKFDIPYLDIFTLWKQRGEDWLNTCLSNDGLHPNAEGYQALLNDVLNWKPMEFLFNQI